MDIERQAAARNKICKGLDMSRSLVDCIIAKIDEELLDQIVEVEQPDKIQELAIKMVPADMLPGRLRPEPTTLDSSEELSN